MEQRDYLMRQIQLMMQTLIALIRKLTGMKDENLEEEYRQVTDTMLREQLNTSLEEILQIPISGIVDFIVNRKGIHISNIDLFAEVLFLNANAETVLNEKKQLLMRALKLLKWADETSGIYSAERHQKINECEISLEQLM